MSISGNVKKIEAGAFAGNSYIKHLVIGDDVTTVGASAFEDCGNLETVSISDDVKAIEQAAFAGCDSLKSVSVGTGLKSLGNAVFAGDKKLSYVSFAKKNDAFACSDGVITNSSGSTVYAVLAGREADSIALSSDVEKIMPYAFWGNKNIKEVVLSGGVKEIPAYAFSHCTNLTSVQIPYSVNSIGVRAFEDCIRLRNITIPSTVRYIHDSAFDGCTRLKIEADEGSAAQEFANNLVLEDIDIAEYEDTDKNDASDSEDEDEGSENDENSDDSTDGEASGSSSEPASVDYYHEVTHINPLESAEDASVVGKGRILGSQTFVFIDNANAVVNSGDPNAVNGENPKQGSGERIESILGNTGEKGGSFPKYTIVDEKIISSQAFYGDDRDTIEIPEGIRRIGDFAFARSEITQALLPEGITDIGYASFYHCDKLADVEIPDTVSYIAPYAFTETSWLNGWLAGGNGADDFLVVGDGILLAYRGGGGMVSIPQGVKQIASGAFKDRTGITGVILPDSVEAIGEEAFENCSNLTGFQGGKGLKQIKDRAFAGCPIADIHIPASVEEVGLRAFDLTGTNADGGTVTFEGSSLPALSYEESSGKLYHEDYRGLAFTGIDTAVVPKGINTKGTILDEAVYGFRGKVGNAADAAPANRGSDTPSETENADGMEETAYTKEALARGDGSGTVTVEIESGTISEGSLALAVLDGAEKDYTLRIADSVAAKQEISSVYQSLYGNQLPSNLQGYDITLIESESGIPITALGKQQIEISIPFPTGIEEDNLHVVCLDSDGQLEEVASRANAVDGISYLTFTTNHFSSYGIYNYTSGNTAQVRDGQAIFTGLSGNLDDSPDTGDHSIHPKWFLGLGLLFTGLALFFYRGRRRV